MPGALAYTDDDLDIVVRNDRFAEMYPVPKELLEPGRPYPAFLRYLAEHGYYGEGDVDALVGARVESLRNPAGRTFEDRAPDGRIYRVGRRRAATGGTVTVITDVTELKDAEDRLRAAVARAEEANRLVTEKNRTLESLSSKLSKYLSPQIYKSIFSGEKGVEVASQRKKLTIFFSDIAGFTETTDLLESEELTNLLNQYLREMSSIALEHGATIDKFIGDAIMLFFGDPETRGPREDATACVRMAIAMQQRMRDLQAEWRERGQEHVFQLRIGINTGFCTVGNFGSNDRVDYTIIGNEVNLAARLQSHADLGGILLAHETYALVKDDGADRGDRHHHGQGLREAGQDVSRRRNARRQRRSGARHPPGAGRPAADHRPRQTLGQGPRRRHQGAPGRRWAPVRNDASARTRAAKSEHSAAGQRGGTAFARVIRATDWTGPVANGTRAPARRLPPPRAPASARCGRRSRACRGRRARRGTS